MQVSESGSGTTRRDSVKTCSTPELRTRNRPGATPSKACGAKRTTQLNDFERGCSAASQPADQLIQLA